jgi:hypothetical protein
MNDAVLLKAEDLLIEAGELATVFPAYIEECREINNWHYAREDEDNPQEPPRGEEEVRALRLQGELAAQISGFTRLVDSKSVTEEGCDEFEARLNDVQDDASELEGFSTLAQAH